MERLKAKEPNYTSISRDEPAKCPSCGCQWFQKKEYMRLSSTSPVFPGAQVPPVADGRLFRMEVFVCAKCGKEILPPLDEPTAIDQEVYSELIDILEQAEKKND